jgi:hypothetical protein
MTRTTRTGLALHTFVPAALFAAATVLGVCTLADPAVATAAPREWDLGTYNNCIERLQDDDGPSYGILSFCCAFSGGIWDDDTGECTAPPATEVERPRQPYVPPPGQATAPLELVTQPMTKRG